MGVRTVAVVALKGGSGKTTIATHLALAAHRRGVDALVVDIDPQCSASDILSNRADPGPPVMTATGKELMAHQFAAIGAGKSLMIVDTAAGALEDASEALVLADYAVMVVRPTLLDLAGLARTLRLVRQLKKPNVVVLNQAPVPRETVEAPLVRRAMRGLDYMQAPVAPAVIRNRAVYQTALETGRSAEESDDVIAAAEIARLWDHVHAALAALPESRDRAAS